MTSCVLCLLLVAAPTLPAEEQVEQARILIRDLHEEEAAALLARVLNDPTLTGALRARALIYAGIAALNLGDVTRARSDFSAALDADANAALPGWVSRRVRSVFDPLVAERERAPRPDPDPTPPAFTVAPVTLGAQAARVDRRPMFVLLGGAVLAATLTVVGFVEWNADHRRALTEPVATRAYALNSSAQTWWYVGEASGIAALGLAAGGIVTWRLQLGPNGIGVAGTL